VSQELFIGTNNMPKLNIPTLNKNEWRGIYPGESSGNFLMSRNIDLEKSEGKIRLSDSYSSIFDSDDDGDLTTPIAFVRSSADGTDRWWSNAGKLFKTTNTNPETGWTQDAIASSPTAPLYDLIDFLGALIAPTDTNLDRLSSGTWTNDWWSSLTGASAMQSGVPHRLKIAQGALIITDGRFINTYDGTIALDPALTLPVGFESRWILPWRDLIFFGGANTVGQEANIYTWRRGLQEEEAVYPIGDTEALCGFVSKGVPHIITKKGAVKKFNGQGFDLVQQFPTVELNLQISSIHPNGVSVQENLARMLVNFGTSANLRTISGIWTFDADNLNLYHSGSVRNTTGNDYAQGELADVGALKVTIPTQGTYLIGAQVYSDYSGTTKYGTFTSDEESTNIRGYFMTPKIPASDVRNYWKYLTTKIFRMDNPGDRIRVYFQEQDSNDLPTNNPDYETITWNAVNQFTASNSDIAVGDLVEVIAGNNAGALERITAISGTTVTIANSLLATSGNARVRYLRFNEIGSISSQAVQEQRFPVSAKSNWCRFLIQLIGSETSPAIERLLIEYRPLNV